MKIEYIDHISINTKNIDESVLFYKNMFGFEEISRADMGPLTLVYLKVDDKTRLELFDLRGACVEGERPEELQGFRHFALHVDDIQAWNEHLKAQGAEFTMELTRMEQISCDGILIKDPNGVIIELSADIK